MKGGLACLALHLSTVKAYYSLVMSTSRIFTCAVEGASMSPVLNPGDWIVAKKYDQSLTTNGLQVGTIVIAQVDQMLHIKRISDIQSDESGKISYWLLGENESASTDSRQYGWVSAQSIMGTYWFRYKRGKRIKKSARPIFKDGRFNI
jgi:signal peptidase I